MTSNPRHGCEEYIMRQKRSGHTGPQPLTLAEFHSHIDSDDFDDGPRKDSFGDGYGEPYNPRRQVFGVLKSGTIVYADLRDINDAILGVSEDTK